MEYRVIVAGGRNFSNYILLSKKLDYYLSGVVGRGDEIIVVSGDACGADKLGAQYAIEHGYRVEHYPADWRMHGRSAGYIRNAIMAKKANALVAFWDGYSRGTAHMIKLAELQKLSVRVVRY